MSQGFEPRIVAYVCNWCTYLGADLAGTTRLEYPANVRIIRLPCTGRIDFNLLVKAFEIGADAVLVSGCHPGDCHYTAGNYHARRRWMLFEPLLEVLGFDMRRIHFTWISAAESRKFQQTIIRITEETRALGPYEYPAKPGAQVTAAELKAAAPAAQDGEAAMRDAARNMLTAGEVDVVIGYGANGPVFIRRAEDVDRLVWKGAASQNLTAYLKRKEVRALGRAAVVVRPPDARTLAVLEQESQIEHGQVRTIPVGEAKPEDFSDLDVLLARSPAERMAYWASEFSRCVKCYACRQACPNCYCTRCVADKNRPVVIDTSPTNLGNFAWQITRAFHQAGRCVGCGACARACPAGIDLRLLNQAVGRAAQQHFGYRAGSDPQASPLVGSWAPTDQEDFIR